MKSIEPGSRIADRYVLESLIARGGMGAVYRTIDERLGRLVAMKVLLPEFAEDKRSLARFEREASAAARLTHPSIVQVLDFGTFEGVAFIVMEHLRGRTIAEELEASGRMAPARAVDVVEQALGAIAAAHAAGIVHRDLKPANLMLVPVGVGGREIVKVLDFGIAQLKESDTYARLTQTGAVLGTPRYMSPEQARGEPCDARTDVYAMGIVLWCCLTGQRPFASSSVGSLIESVLGEMPPRADRVVSEVPAAIARICERAIEKRPSARWSSASAFAAALVEARGATTGPSASAAPSTGKTEAPTIASPRARPRPRMPTPTPSSSSVDLSTTSLVLPTHSRRWLRIAVGVGVVLAIGALGLFALLGIGAFELERWIAGRPSPIPSMPSMPSFAPAIPETVPTHPPPPGMTPVCDAAYRCCLRTSNPESTCDLFGANPPSCQENLDTFTSVLRAYAIDPSVCAVRNAPP